MRNRFFFSVKFFLLFSYPVLAQKIPSGKIFTDTLLILNEQCSLLMKHSAIIHESVKKSDSLNKYFHERNLKRGTGNLWASSKLQTGCACLNYYFSLNYFERIDFLENLYSNEEKWDKPILVRKHLNKLSADTIAIALKCRYYEYTYLITGVLFEDIATLGSYKSSKIFLGHWDEEEYISDIIDFKNSLGIWRSRATINAQSNHVKTFNVINYYTEERILWWYVRYSVCDRINFLRLICKFLVLEDCLVASLHKDLDTLCGSNTPSFYGEGVFNECIFSQNAQIWSATLNCKFDPP